MIIQIDGWFAGGKSVLWSLLDGHKDIYVSPLHDYTFSRLLKEDCTPWIKSKNLLFLRKILLGETSYYKFEQILKYGTLDISLSSEETIKLPYNIDFYTLDRNYINTIEKLEKWTPEILIETLYETLYKTFIKSHQTKKYYASMGNAYYYKNYKNIPKIFPNMKSIIVKRDIKNIIASRINRKVRPIDVKEHNAFASEFEIIIKSREIEKIVDYFKTLDFLSKRYPNKFFIVEFDDLVKNTKNTMKKISNFLEIKFEEVLTKPTRDGRYLQKNGISFIGQENDTYEKLLTENEVDIINERIKSCNPNTNLNLKSDYNYKLSKDINKIISQINHIKESHNKIILYGNGNICKLISTLLADKLLCIVDQKEALDSENKKVINPLKLRNLNFDVILITVLGRELEIINDLITLYQVEKNKIISFNIED
ncbi:hypothetical protein CP965_07305 [Halarcobacter mediterraneus]|uniref:Sulfotransferase domain-containing protein n=1 Tax=Halarcobacter mediterraneus TaxID=2023153 RepID=A0A4Q1B5J9_9BACT|nr:sulfotransferase domain-containing protein [Halarcobacter mediterraneus]RXK13597.1 hypothetical protein CP965_07305 [Halarcobacter mediterraneus]